MTIFDKTTTMGSREGSGNGKRVYGNRKKEKSLKGYPLPQALVQCSKQRVDRKSCVF